MCLIVLLPLLLLLLSLLLQVDAAGQSFHTVIVVNDRLQLDKQLGDTVKAFIAGATEGWDHAFHCLSGWLREGGGGHLAACRKGGGPLEGGRGKGCQGVCPRGKGQG